MTEMVRCTLIVIGGGPAGSSAARRAAERGARVLLLEKRPMPRPKLCGGWVSQKALDWLGFDIAPEAAMHSFQTLETHIDSTITTFSHTQSIGVFVDRALFDAHLMRKARDAGVTVLFKKATEINTAGNVLRISTVDGVYESENVILCTGAGGQLLTTVRQPDTKKRSGACLEQRLPAEYAGGLNISPGTARLYFGEIPYGFGWVLHHGTYLLIGIGSRRTQVQHLRGMYDIFWQSLRLPAEGKKPQGHLIPFGGFKRILGRGRCLLAGDAAGFADAFSGEGIAYAIRSGQLAADALLDRPGSAASHYRTLCRREILRPLRQSLWAARIFYKLPRPYLKWFCTNRTILSRYHDVLQGNLSYRAFISRGLMDLLIGQKE